MSVASYTSMFGKTEVIGWGKWNCGREGELGIISKFGGTSCFIRQLTAVKSQIINMKNPMKAILCIIWEPLGKTGRRATVERRTTQQ